MTDNIRTFYYTGPYTSTLLPDSDALIARLNAERRKRLERRIDGAPRALDLAAVRLLEIGMRASGHDSFALADIAYPSVDGLSEKPVWTAGIADFSISHSRGIVVCAIASQCRVGVDAERRRSIDPGVVRRLLRDESEPLTEEKTALRWTQIEAVLKGAGIGIMHGREIEWVDATANLTTARLRGQTWRLHDIAVGPDHVAHVAVNDIAATITAEQIVEL